MIDVETYSLIHKLMPIPCVDLAIINDKKILLVERKQEPAKGRFYFPGGRIRRNETIDMVIDRIASTEVGLIVTDRKVIGCDNLIFPTDPFGHGYGTHGVCIVIRCRTDVSIPELDQNHNSYVWWDGSEMDLDDYVKKFGSEVLNAERNIRTCC